MTSETKNAKQRRILGRVSSTEFIGRAAELEQIVAHAQRPAARGLLLLLAPAAGVSELLRQAYDALFNERGKVVPVYFALPREAATPVSVALEFLNTFLLQYVAFRRHEPALCHAALSLHEVLELAPAADFEWIEQLVDAYNRERFGNDDQALVRWCLSAPQKVPPRRGRVFVMLDGVALAGNPGKSSTLGLELIRVLSRSARPYTVAGPRRQLLDTVHSIDVDFGTLETIKLEPLADAQGRALVEQLARRHQVSLGEATRDLIAQQLECSPFFITAFMQAARERNIALTSYLACEQLYADELLGGHISRHYSALLEEIAPAPATRRHLMRLLYEATVTEECTASFESWRKQLHLEVGQLERILSALHVQELITWDENSITVGGGPQVWRDYLRLRFRLEITDEPRALVVADTITESLKRAPSTMARHYRRASASGLRELLARFDCQRVPASLFDYERFSQAYKGKAREEIVAGLDNEVNLIRLPQVVHVASCVSFSPDMQQLCDEESCVVGHTFSEGTYSDANEEVWVAAEIDARIEVDRDLVAVWCECLESLAREWHFRRVRLWLVAREGFTPEACQLLKGLGAYGSSRQQAELLTARLDESPTSARESSLVDEFEMTVPMGGDNEMIVAHTVEQIARRLHFQPAAINQIKHAVIEACINASEHSLSPDQKIYQRFRAEDDKLVITISSRGILPAGLGVKNGEPGVGPGAVAGAGNRRGLGLSMIRTLMDEVEFERVDDGTSLRMIKYRRK